MALRFLLVTSKMFYNGIKITFRSLAKALKEEVDLSNERARIRNKEKLLELPASEKTLTVEEAMQILNVSSLDSKEIESKFHAMFLANKRGSFYIQSKILRAKERLDTHTAQVENFRRRNTELDGQ